MILCGLLLLIVIPHDGNCIGKNTVVVEDVAKSLCCRYLIFGVLFEFLDWVWVLHLLCISNGFLDAILCLYLAMLQHVYRFRH